MEGEGRDEKNRKEKIGKGKKRKGTEKCKFESKKENKSEM